jgi:hypothetical protein
LSYVFNISVANLLINRPGFFGCSSCGGYGLLLGSPDLICKNKTEKKEIVLNELKETEKEKGVGIENKANIEPNVKVSYYFAENGSCLICSEANNGKKGRKASNCYYTSSPFADLILITPSSQIYTLIFKKNNFLCYFQEYFSTSRNYIFEIFIFLVILMFIYIMIMRWRGEEEIIDYLVEVVKYLLYNQKGKFLMNNRSLNSRKRYNPLSSSFSSSELSPSPLEPRITRDDDDNSPLRPYITLPILRRLVFEIGHVHYSKERWIKVLKRLEKESGVKSLTPFVNEDKLNDENIKRIDKINDKTTLSSHISVGYVGDENLMVQTLEWRDEDEYAENYAYFHNHDRDEDDNNKYNSIVTPNKRSEKIKLSLFSRIGSVIKYDIPLLPSSMPQYNPSSPFSKSITEEEREISQVFSENIQLPIYIIYIFIFIFFINVIISESFSS